MVGYLTRKEFKSAPVASDTLALVWGGNAAEQDAALDLAISRASRLMDRYVGAGLSDRLPYFAASVRTATNRGSAPTSPSGLAAGGWVHLRPGPFPLVSLVSLSVGVRADQLTAYTDLAGIWIDEEAFVVPLLAYNWPLIRYTYVSGYPNTTLSSSTAAAATAIPVASSVGFQVGQIVTVADGALAEDVTVLVVPDATHVTLAAPGMVNAHASGTAFHAMPEDLKMAAVFTTAALLRVKGNDAMVMGQTLAPAHRPGADTNVNTNLTMARELLEDYRRLGVVGLV